MSDIFICYSRTDGPVARQLTEQLRAEGWEVYMDVQTPIGSRWDKEIQNQLQAAKAVVVLWSVKSTDSVYVLEEAEHGRENNKLFPARIEPVKLPYGFSRIQTADMIGWAGGPDHPGLVQLLAALRAHLGVGRQALSAVGVGNESRHGDADLLVNPVNKPTVIQPPPATPFIPGQTFRDPLKLGGEGSLPVVIPPGRFLMGSPDYEPERLDREGPQHEVIIPQPFALGVCAVTFADYDLFCCKTQRELPHDPLDWGRGDRPVIDVSWQDAQDYCAWLSQLTGYGYRLPSEAEWEYACRAGTLTPFSFGGNITPEQVNYNGYYPYAGGKQGHYQPKTASVQSLPANVWGLYEMHGNVSEWVQDAWHDTYTGAPTDGSAWESAEADGTKVLRGGCFISGAGNCRSASRFRDSSVNRGINIGFRCARVQVVSK